MFRVKTLIVLAGMVAALLVSAAPASAWWEGATAAKGPITVTSGGTFIDAGVEVKCPANEITAEWNIQTKGQIKIHQREEKQLKTKLGPHLNINVTKWGGRCKANLPPEVEAKVSACELQLVQVKKGSFNATGGVVTPCRITIPAAGCTVTIPAGMETSPQSEKGLNVGLQEAVLLNVGANQKDVVNITEQIFAEGAAPCPATNGTASLTGLEFTAEGVKVV